MLERRYAELRGDGERGLSGVAIRYGDTATMPWGQERFMPGAFAPLGDCVMNRMHDRSEPLARTGGAGLELVDDNEALRISATLPNTRAADDVLELVRAGVMRGLSIGFHPISHRIVGNVRVIERAKLTSISVVDTPAYPQSEVEARMAEIRKIQSSSFSLTFGHRMFWT